MVEITKVRKDEIYQDTVTYCNIILDILKDWKSTNDDPPGRIILECKWLGQEIENDRLAIPFYDEITSIRHTYVTSDMPDDANEKDIYRYMGYITKIASGKLLLKSEHYPIAISEIDQIIVLLQNSKRILSLDEKGMLSELNLIKNKLSDKSTLIPLSSDVNSTFKHFWKVYDYDESTIDDIPEAHEHLNRIANMVFQSVRDKVIEW